MRYVVACVAVLALFTQPCAEKKDELRLADVKKLVQEYVSDKTVENYRKTIEDKLATADTALLSKALGGFIKDDAEGKRAIEFAIKHRIPGLWSNAKKILDGDLEDMVIEYGLMVQDKGAVDTLIDRWKKLEADSASFSILNDAMQGCVLPLETLESFYKTLKGSKAEDPKRELVFALLKAQLGADEVETPDDLIAGWAKIFALVKSYGQDFKLEGDNLLALPDWGVNGKKVRANWFLSSGGAASLKILPEKLQTGNWLVRIRVYVISGNGVTVGLSSESGTWRPKLEGEEWLLKSGNAQSYALAATREKWSTIEFSLTDESTENVRMSRKVTIFIDGEPFRTDHIQLAINGKLTEVFVEAGQGEVVFGGVELVKK